MEKFSFKKLLKEMATIGTVGQMKVVVWTDHNPPHFHVTKLGEYEVRITIKNLKILDYKWQKNNTEMSSTEKSNLKKWLQSPSKKNKSLTNLQGIKFAWKILNEVEK